MPPIAQTSPATPSTKQETRQIPRPPGQGFTNEEPTNTQRRLQSPDERFRELKLRFAKAVGIVAGLIALIFTVGTYKKGWSFPSRFLQVIGDAFGTIATVSFPVAEVVNECKNFTSTNGNGNHNTNGNGKDKKAKFFDDYLDFDYRVTSHGLFPYIYERLLNPNNITKSIFHKAAAILNIPFILFTGYAWAFGNTQALIAWGLRKAEVIRGNNTSDEAKKGLHELRADDYNRIYNSAERLLRIGSTANPVMPCLQYCADGLHALVSFVKGENSIKDLFKRPILSLSKAGSIFVAIPEAIAKGVDAVMRVLVSERDHLKPVLPDFAYNRMKAWGDWIEKRISNPKEDHWVKRLKNNSEMLFHAVSPFAMAFLFAQMLDRSNKSEEAQAQGGTTASLDKWLGRYGKTITILFTGFYVFLSRLPQGVFQSIYFGRKLIGKWFKKETEEQSQKALITLRQKIHDNPIVTGISKFARKCITFCVPNFYDELVDNKYGDPSYIQVLAKYSLDQAKEEHKILFDILRLYSIKQLETKIHAVDQIVEALKTTNQRYIKEIGLDLEACIEGATNGDETIKELLTQKIIGYCLAYAKKECIQGYYELDEHRPNESKEIERLIRSKIKHLSTPPDKRESQQLQPRFPFALFLVRNFLDAFDIQSFLPTWHHDKANKLEYYQGKEMNKAFNKEYEVVKCENADCARRFVNWSQGIAYAH